MTVHTFYFFFHDSTHFTVSAPHICLQHTHLELIHTLQLRRFSMQVQFITTHLHKTCLSLLHLNIYLYIHIMLFFYLRKLTRFCLDEISAALISFHCCCQLNSGVSSNHIKRRISEDMITW
jgi:hypothetical protein